jgi:homocysteine S-methyltransferase
MGATLDVAGRLAAGDVVILDGGTGSQLQAEVVPIDELACSARANLAHPGSVRRVHEEYIRAGAQVIIANIYAASRSALEPAGLSGQAAEVNRAAMRAALDAARTRRHSRWQWPARCRRSARTSWTPRRRASPGSPA